MWLRCLFVRPLGGAEKVAHCSAALGEHQTPGLQQQLDPAVGLERADRDDLAAGSDDDGDDGSSLGAHGVHVDVLRLLANLSRWAVLKMQLG